MKSQDWNISPQKKKLELYKFIIHNEWRGGGGKKKCLGKRTVTGYEKIKLQHLKFDIWENKQNYQEKFSNLKVCRLSFLNAIIYQEYN